MADNNQVAIAEIKAGTPKLDLENKRFDFSDHHNPNLETAKKSLAEIEGVIDTKLGASSVSLEEFVSKNADKLSQAELDAIAKYNAKNILDLRNKATDSGVKAKIEEHIKPHVENELAVHEKVKKDIVSHETDSLAAKYDAAKKYELPKEASPAHIEAYKEAKEALRKEATIARIEIKPTMLDKHFGNYRVEGMGATLRKNFNFAKTPIKSLARVGGVGVGVVTTYDAFARAQSTGPDGKPQDRSMVMRLLEGGAGIGLAAGSALHGGFSR